MTIYRLYCENGNRAGFWVQHRSWRNLCARVQSIGGQKFGVLPGESPRHHDAVIRIVCFDVRSGRQTELEALAMDLGDRNFSMIARPPWHKAVEQPTE